MKKLIPATLTALLTLLCFAVGAWAEPAQAYVTYEQYGAIGDGVTDDLDAIIAAHAQANAENLPVKAASGAVYCIAQTGKTAIIQTDTDWRGASFIIDDSAVQVGQGHATPIFEIRSKLAAQNLSVPAPLQKEQTNIGVPLGYDALVYVEDSSVLRYIRKGVNANDGQKQQEVLAVDQDGSISADTPLLWDYNGISAAIAYPTDTQTLTISGGTFTTIANQAESQYNYHHRGISITRSNTVIDGLVHLITGELDHGAPYRGFVDITRCKDVTVQNTTLSGHKYYVTDRNGSNSSMGTYDININTATHVTFKDCVQANSIHDSALWGIMGSNYVKNITLDGVEFSRFDAHQGVCNVTIRNSKLGRQGINLIGSGTALIENTTVSSDNFINLRSDYGSVWDGEVIIRNCVFDQNNGKGTNHALIGGSNNGSHDFGYPCTMPYKVTIDGLKILDKKHSFFYFGPQIFDNFDGPWRVILDLFQKPPHPYGITEDVSLNNITTESGRCLWKGWNFLRFWNTRVTR